MRARSFSPAVLLLCLLLKLVHANVDSRGAILGSKDWLLAPEASFRDALSYLMVLPPGQMSSGDGEAAAERSRRIDVGEVKQALEAAGATNASEVLAAYEEFAQQVGALTYNGQETEAAQPEIGELLERIDGLEARGVPTEFGLYLRGKAEFRAGYAEEARADWEELLGLPEGARRRRSVWAAFMLARAWSKTPEVAREYLELTRRLARVGYGDPLGLAEDTVGWEARVEYLAKHFGKALDLYLRKPGDPSCLESLRWVAAAAIDEADPAVLRALAENETHRKIITAFLVSGGLSSRNSERFVTWTRAVESAGAGRAEFERQCLALAAYQVELLDEAKHWLGLAAESPLNRWLRAKILLREGNVGEASRLLRSAAKEMPRLAHEGERPRKFEQTLWLQSGYGRSRSAAEKAWGEVGVVELARGNFKGALEGFMKGDYWQDAALVAERILTPEELKETVTENWLPGESEPEIAKRLRHLLARRLFRSNRGWEARVFYPESLQPVFDELAAALQDGFDAAFPAKERAAMLMKAARLVRHRGLELLGTELEPDFAIHDGNLTWALTVEERMAHEPEQLGPTEEEKRRLRASAMRFSPRFHYRYVGAELAWLAAALMPNDDSETARVLDEAGSWIKNLDPQRADRFYKALVRRCRGTELGVQADKLRWFPSLEAVLKLEASETEDEQREGLNEPVRAE